MLAHEPERSASVLWGLAKSLMRLRAEPFTMGPRNVPALHSGIAIVHALFLCDFSADGPTDVGNDPNANFPCRQQGGEGTFTNTHSGSSIRREILELQVYAYKP